MMEKKICWECSKKRRKCDGGVPACKKCVTRGLTCPGYDKMPLKWLTPGQTRSKGKTATYEKAVVSMPSWTDVPRQLVPKDAVAIVDGIQYYNEVMVPDGNAFRWASEKNPYFLDAAYLAYLPQPLLEGLICTTLGHRMMTTAHATGSSQAMVLAKKMQYHRGRALEQLSEYIADPDLRTHEITLASILSLLLSEIQLCTTPPNWQDHANAAFAIIKARGGLATLMEVDVMNHLLRYLILIDVMGMTTTPIPPNATVIRQRNIINLIPGLFGASITTAVPCPAPILMSIIQITCLRPVLQTDVLSTAGLFSQMNIVLERIRSFNPEEWSRSAILEMHRITDADNPKNLDDTSHAEWTHLASVYQHAAALYCISALFTVADEIDWLSMDEETATCHQTVQLLKDSCRKSLMRNLKEISSREASHHRKLNLWPLVVAGMTSLDDDDGSRSYILKELQWIGRTLGTASALVAANYLKAFWKRGGAGAADGGWQSYLDNSYVFI